MLLFTLSMPSSNVKGEDNIRLKRELPQFAINANIQEIIDRIFTFSEIIDIPLIKSLNPLHLLAAVGQNGKSVLTSGKKFSKV